MDRVDSNAPISVILSGSDNYDLWMQSMKSFLIGKKRWRIVTGDILPPARPVGAAGADPTAKDLEAYGEKLEDWDSKNHQILTWVRNTSIPAIQVQLASFDNAKKAWDFLATRFQSTGLAHYYQLWSTIYSLRQEPGQPINDFLAQVQPLWDRLDQTDISKDHQRLIQILMSLRPEYEAVRASLLHRHPLPTLDAAVQEIIFEETRLRLDRTPQFDSALAVPYRPPASSQQARQPPLGKCKICRNSGHTFASCPKVEFHHCHGLGHIAPNCPSRPPRPAGQISRPHESSQTRHSSVTAVATNDVQQSPLSPQDIEAIFK